MRPGRGRCVICTANSDEFPTFEPESYLSSRSHDCLLRAALAHSLGRAVNYSERKVSASARASAIDDSVYRTFRSPSLDSQNERYRNKICPRLPTESSPSSSSHLVEKIERKRRGRRKREKYASWKRITRDTGRWCRLLFLPYRFLFLAFYPLSRGTR